MSDELDIACYCALYTLRWLRITNTKPTPREHTTFENIRIVNTHRNLHY